MLYDTITKRNRGVWMYTGLLSCSRLPYIEFVYSMNQQSFTGSAINMFNFYDGVPEYLSIDNLKTGVIKPDLYEPLLNQAFAEMTSYYGTFINTCRVKKPKDKGKIERLIPVARELFRMLKHTIENSTLDILNQKAREWILKEYGQKIHGTTGQKPLEIFKVLEKSKLKPLPEQVFEIPVWKKVKVHPDRFIQFDKKRYCLPARYRRMELWAKKSGKTLYIYDKNYHMIRQYVITNKKVNYLESDFPEEKCRMLRSYYPRELIREASLYGIHSRDYIASVLQPHAFINLRRAMGLLRVIKNNSFISKLDDVCIKATRMGIVHPKKLQSLMDAEESQQDLPVPISSTGRLMIRDSAYYIK
jgi:hypothetical protein